MKYDVIVVGAGFAGSVMARCFAEDEKKVLVIDELDKSLHPYLVQYIVEIFNDLEFNKNGSQLIFNIQDTNLLDLNILRRDQIWFVQKDEFGYSELVALSDFKVRSDASFEKDYLAGVYGGIPNLKEFELKEGV